MCMKRYVMSIGIWMHMPPLMQSTWPPLIFATRKDVHALNTSVYICCAHVIPHFMWGWVVGICYQCVGRPLDLVDWNTTVKGPGPYMCINWVPVLVLGDVI